MIQPKPYIDRLRLRNHAVGTERRRNMSKIILENQTYFPKPVLHEDIDKAFFEWVDKKIEVIYNGKRLPTYKLFSNQKLSEYSQTWSNLDDTGNIIMNFKTITRENNPQHGESQGGYGAKAPRPAKSAPFPPGRTSGPAGLPPRRSSQGRGRSGSPARRTGG